jgi:hypothetical protein
MSGSASGSVLGAMELPLDSAAMAKKKVKTSSLINGCLIRTLTQQRIRSALQILSVAEYCGAEGK